MIGHTDENHEFLATAITSGKLQAEQLLETGTPEQKIVARRYLECLENARSFYQSKPIDSSTFGRKNMKIEKSETTYRAQLKASEYDFLEVVQDMESRITIKFLDTRWRTVPATISMLQEIIESLKTLTPKK